MAVCKVYILAVLTALVAVNLIFAEDYPAYLGEDTEREARSPPHEPNSPPHEPNSPPHEPNSPPHGPNSPPQGPRSPPQEPNDAEPNDAERNPEEAQERTFFTLLGLASTFATTCNYTTTPGATCLSCRQALTCFATNQGVLRTCRGLLPYCNAGRCSFIPGAACLAG